MFEVFYILTDDFIRRRKRLILCLLAHTRLYLVHPITLPHRAELWKVATLDPILVASSHPRCPCRELSDNSRWNGPAWRSGATKANEGGLQVRGNSCNCERKKIDGNRDSYKKFCTKCLISHWADWIVEGKKSVFATVNSVELTCWKTCICMIHYLSMQISLLLNSIKCSFDIISSK